MSSDRATMPVAGPAAREPGAMAAPGEIPLCTPVMHPSAWTYVKECLDTGWVSSVGTFVTRFEQAMAAAVGEGVSGVATTSGTAALHVALQLAGVRRDDEVLVSTLTFIAPANAIRYLGAHPVFVDAEPEYWQMDARAVVRFLREQCDVDGGAVRNRVTGRRVAAIVPVHILGHPVDLDPILEVAREVGLPVVEDATEALGAKYRGQPIGSFGASSCLSFNGNKLLTTGGGGMLLSADPALVGRARHLTTQAKSDPIEFVHDEVGYNYRLSNVLAAIGVSQAEQLTAHLAAKRSIARRYEAGLGDLPGITTMREAPWADSAFWLYTILIDASRFGSSSRDVLRALQAEGIQTRPLWQPMHRSPAHAGEGSFDCPVADALVRDALSLPCSIDLTPAQQDRVIAVLRRLGGASA